MKQNFFLLILFLLLLCNCGPKKPRHKIADMWMQQEAKLYDIPILIDAQPESNGKEHDSLSQVVYCAHVDLNDALSFYEQEMERFGWNLLTLFIDDEALLIFDKPTKMCSISLRPSKQDLRVVIFLKPKE